MTDRFLILKRGALRSDPDAPAPQTLWAELGEIEADYHEQAVLIAAETHGVGNYMVLASYGRPERYTVTPRSGFDVEKVAEPTLAEVVERAA